jgi:hypothetical protein
MRIFRERVKTSWGRDSMLFERLTRISMSTPAENSFLLFFFIFLDTDPHLASVCVISISFPFRDTSCVCVWELVYVCACEHKFGVATNHGKF